MREDVPPWTEEDEEPRGRVGRTRSRPWVLLLGVAPWLVVAGLGLTGLPHGDPPERTVPATDPQTDAGVPTGGNGAADHASGESTGEPDLPGDPGIEGSGPQDPPAVAGGGPGPAGPGTPAGHGHDPRIVATALLVARAWLTDVGPRLEVSGIRPRADLYLEHATVEHVDVAGDHAVVTLSTVVLERQDDVYATARPRRLGVPLALGDPPRPAGEPWWLQDAELAPSEPQLVEEPDPDLLLALGEELGAAGAAAGDVLDAGRTVDGWWVVTAEPASGGEDPPVRVWLPPLTDRGEPPAGDRRSPDEEDEE